MTERMSDGELKARFEGVEKRFEGIDKRLDRMVTIDVWTSENGHMRDKVEELDRDCEERSESVKKVVREVNENKQNVWMRVLQAAGIVATLAAAWLTAYMASKGTK